MTDIFTEDDVNAIIGQSDPAKPDRKSPIFTEEEAGRIGATGDLPNLDPGFVETIARGVGKGATLGFSDELVAAVAAALGQVEGAKFGDRYELARDLVRRWDQQAKQARPKTFKAAEIAGGVAAGAALPAGAVSTVPRAAGTGAGFGAVQAAGESTADPLSAEMAKDIAIGTGTGAVAGAIGNLLGKGVSRLFGRKGEGAEAVARTAHEGAEEASAIGFTMKGRKFAEASDALEAQVKEIDPSFRFRPSQKFGDPALAAQEQFALQAQGTMRQAQTEAHNQLRAVSKFLDAQIDNVAANPATLGRANVMDDLAKTHDDWVEGLFSAKSSAVNPMYETAEQMAGGAHLFRTEHYREFSKQMEVKEIFGSVAPKLSSIGRKLDKAADPTSKNVRYETIKSLRSFWTDVIQGRQKIGGGSISPDKAKVIAGKALDAIEEDLASSAQISGIAEDVAQTLEMANRTNRQYMELWEESVPEAVERILEKRNADITTMSDAELRDVFGFVNKASPRTAMQLRAQAMDQWLTKAGKPARGAPEFFAEEGFEELRPGAAFKFLRDNGSKLAAMYEGDPRALLMLKQNMQILDRLRFGPGYINSQTEFARQIGEAARRLPGGDTALKYARLLATDETAQAIAASTPDGIEATNAILKHMAEQMERGIPGRALGAAAKSKPVSGKTTILAIATLTDLGLDKFVEPEGTF